MCVSREPINLEADGTYSTYSGNPEVGDVEVYLRPAGRPPLNRVRRSVTDGDTISNMVI